MFRHAYFPHCFLQLMGFVTLAASFNEIEDMQIYAGSLILERLKGLLPS